MFLSTSFSMSEKHFYQILWLKYYKNEKSDGQMTLIEIVSVFPCIEIQNILKNGGKNSEKMSTAKFNNNKLK